MVVFVSLLLVSLLLCLLKEVVKWVRLCLGVDSVHELLTMSVCTNLKRDKGHVIAQLGHVMV